MKRIAISTLGLALVISLVPVTSYAQTTTERSVATQRCTMAKQKIATHTAAIAATQANHATKYTTIQQRVDTLVSSAVKANYTAIEKLTAARNSVTKAITDYTTQATVYTTALATAQSAACGEGTGEFMSALATARTELKALRVSSAAVKTVVKQNAIPALRDYATWLKTNADSTQENQ